MPELPEVETIRRQLEELIVGKKIKDVKILLPKIVKVSLARFKKAVIGAKIKKAGRRAKILVLELSNGWSLLMHLKMTGQLIYQKFVQRPGSPRIRYGAGLVKSGMTKGKHTHVIFYFTDGTGLIFNDLRQFGYIKLIRTEDLAEFFIKEKIGPEPLEKDFTPADFKVLLAQRPKVRIKQFLMDPKIIAGIGNIYADEILFFARVHPLRRAETLKNGEVEKIYNGIRNILVEAIKLKGTSSNDYLDAYGRKGGFAEKLKVYGREGEKCVKCRGKIERIKIGGRSAHFCPVCQPR